MRYWRLQISWLGAAVVVRVAVVVVIVVLVMVVLSTCSCFPQQVGGGGEVG